MSYVNKIGGNEISDDAVRKVIDDEDKGLRKEIYWLSHAVRGLMQAIVLSNGSYTIKNAYNDISNQKISGFKECSRGFNEVTSMYSRHSQKAFPEDKNKKNIL